VIRRDKLLLELPRETFVAEPRFTLVSFSIRGRPARALQAPMTASESKIKHTVLGAAAASDVTPPPVSSISTPGVEAPPPASAPVSGDNRPSIPVPPPSAAPDPYVGTTIDGRYKVESVLGEGGMGVVYLARHKVIDKRVAIKVLRADMARDKEITERFVQEAKAASSIGNPHIIDISDFGDLPDGSTYFVMEFLDGKPLGKVLEETRPLPIARLIEIARQIAEGLAGAHQRGIVHRDLKPDNIFLVRRGSETDFVKILDFGIAKVGSGTAKLTRAGSVFGTPHYMSPEQAAGSPVDSRTDIYALGVILYEMASGKVPFDADNFMGILTQHMYKAPVPIRALVPPQDIPPGLEAVILKALSKKPEQRYQTMEEVAADLEKVLNGTVPDAVPEMMARSGGFNVPADFYKERGMPAPVPGTPRGPARKPWGMVAGIAGVLAAVAIVVGVFAKSSSSTASSGPANTAPVAAPTPAPTPEPAAAPTQSAAPAIELKHVLFAAEPLDAHVFLGEQDLGQPPLTVDVPVGQKVTVEVRREGYKTKSLTLDGTEAKQTVKLARDLTVRAPPVKKPEKPAATGAASKPSSPSLGGSEIVNPWAK
jgi:tRNA A-37 threonylcarbamoyl transferase component Bud32